MRNDLINAVLDCGIDDLSMLDDSGADMYEMVKQMKEKGLPISLNGIMEEIFKDGISRMDEAVKEKQAELEKKERHGILNKKEYEQMKAIHLHDLNPNDDFQYYLNYQDTHLRCDNNKKEVYEEMFEQEMQVLMDYTGFNIEG